MTNKRKTPAQLAPAPGPWTPRLGAQGWIVVGPDPSPVSGKIYERAIAHVTPRIDGLANARLIAAAPAMRAALEFADRALRAAEESDSKAVRGWAVKSDEVQRAIMEIADALRAVTSDEAPAARTR
jgi:hypothetical protein